MIDIPPSSKTRLKAFTVLELLVAVSVTALLAGMLFNITSQVMKTQNQASGNLETNQVAQFVLDRIQEDLQCAIFRSDGYVWMAADILENSDNSGEWEEAEVPKPTEKSLRVLHTHWPSDLVTPNMEANMQGLLRESRFGLAGVWLRFFSGAPEVDPNAENTGGARAISYQIVRHGLTGSGSSTPRYQLFRSDVSNKNTLTAGYNLDPDDGNYTLAASMGPREAGNIQNPLFTKSGSTSTDFSLASNVVDFGIRAYVLRKQPQGTSYLYLVFPDLKDTGSTFSYKASSNPNYYKDPQNKLLNAFPDVVDVMVRIMTTEGSNSLAAFEDGLIPAPEDMDKDEFWWDLVEKNSEVYVRRIKIFAKGL